MYSQNRDTIVRLPVRQFPNLSQQTNSAIPAAPFQSSHSQNVSNGVCGSTAEKRHNYKWTDPRQDRILLRLMLHETEKRTPFPFKSHVWHKIERRYNREIVDNPADKHQLQSRWQSLRKMLKVWKKAKRNSGWQWDDKRNVPVCTKESWDEWCKASANNCIKQYYNKPFPYEDIIDRIAPTQTATGEHASGTQDDSQIQYDSQVEEGLSFNAADISQSTDYEQENALLDTLDDFDGCRYSARDESQQSQVLLPHSQSASPSLQNEFDDYDIFSAPIVTSSPPMCPLPTAPATVRQRNSAESPLMPKFKNTNKPPPPAKPNADSGKKPKELTAADRLNLAMENLGVNLYTGLHQAQEDSNFQKGAIQEFMKLTAELKLPTMKLISIVEMLKDEQTANMFLSMNDDFRRCWILQMWEQAKAQKSDKVV